MTLQNMLPKARSLKYCFLNLCVKTSLFETNVLRQTYFHMKGFARRLVLKQKPKRTRKWPICDALLHVKNNV